MKKRALWPLGLFVLSLFWSSTALSNCLSSEGVADEDLVNIPNWELDIKTPDDSQPKWGRVYIHNKKFFVCENNKKEGQAPLAISALRIKMDLSALDSVSYAMTRRSVSTERYQVGLHFPAEAEGGEGNVITLSRICSYAKKLTARTNCYDYANQRDAIFPPLVRALRAEKPYFSIENKLDAGWSDRTASQEAFFTLMREGIAEVFTEWKENPANLAAFNTIIRYDRYVLIGDSLTDTGSMANKLGGLLKGAALLTKSGTGSAFSNKHNWLSYLITRLVVAKYMTRYPADETIDLERLREMIQGSSFKKLYIDGKLIVWNLSEGGAAASKSTSKAGFKQFISSAFILKNLHSMRAELLARADAEGWFEEEGVRILIFEMTGANDLITINIEATREGVEKAVKERLENLSELIQAGFRSFVLGSLPDLSVTPRFHNPGMKSTYAQVRAHGLVGYFMAHLELGVKNVRAKFHSLKDLRIDLFDSTEAFMGTLIAEQDFSQRTRTFLNLENELRSLSSKKEPEEESSSTATAEAPDTESEASSEGIIVDLENLYFWDDVHPTEVIYAAIARDIIAKLSNTGTLDSNFLHPHDGSRLFKNQQDIEDAWRCLVTQNWYDKSMRELTRLQEVFTGDEDSLAILAKLKEHYPKALTECVQEDREINELPEEDYLASIFLKAYLNERLTEKQADIQKLAV